MKAWFVSDIHITGSEDPRRRRFEDFLRARLNDGTTHLFLVGDIFDLWVGGDGFFTERYRGIFDLIGQLRSKNVDVIYFEGNHDLHLGASWSEELGCRVFVAPAYFDLGAFRVRVEHGDQMNPDDKGYLFLRGILRTPVVEWLAHALPGSIIQKVGNTMSRSSRKWTTSALKARDEAAIHRMVRSHALNVFNDDEPFDFIVTGHVHVRDDYKWKDLASHREVRSINLGWWTIDATPQSFCVDDQGGRWITVE